jgi:hypothetical protein
VKLNCPVRSLIDTSTSFLFLILPHVLARNRGTRDPIPGRVNLLEKFTSTRVPGNFHAMPTSPMVQPFFCAGNKVDR